LCLVSANYKWCDSMPATAQVLLMGTMIQKQYCGFYNTSMYLPYQLISSVEVNSPNSKRCNCLVIWRRCRWSWMCLGPKSRWGFTMI
jgi:hypothetical protein